MNVRNIKSVGPKFTLFLALVLSFLNIGTAQAGFPEDLDDVVFIEDIGTRRPGLTEFVRNMAVTGTLEVEIGGANTFGGQNVILDNSRRNAWPNTIFACCNANAWIVVKVEDTWYAGTWEFMRVGQTTKSTKALVGPGHIRFPPLENFRPKNGEIYGYFMSCLVRNGITPRHNNCRERTSVALHKFGEGPVGFDAITGPSASAVGPAINLLIDDTETP